MNARICKSALYDQIAGDIFTLRRAPGEAVDEAVLAKTSGLSRTPLREVLQKLAGEGYLTYLPNRGNFVSEMSHRTLRDFFLVAPMIYAATARLAALSPAPEKLAELKNIQAEFQKALAAGDAAKIAFANNRFHAQIGLIADNAYLRPSLNRLLIDHSRISMTFYGGRREEAVSQKARDHQHDALIVAIENQDEAEAEAITHDHWALSRAQIEKFVLPQALDGALGVMVGGMK